MAFRPPLVALAGGLLVAALASCDAPQAFGRPTTASVANSDDPWLVGEPCSPDAGVAQPLRPEVLAEGTGAPITPGATVRVHYVASVPGGKVVHDSDSVPSEIVLGSTKAMCGFERALLGMRPGEQRRVVVPWQLALGDVGRPPDIPPRADLTFVIDLYLPAGVVNSLRGPPVNPMAGPRR